MENISRIKKISIWVFIIPVLVLNLCLFISVNYHLFENTIFSVDQIGRSGFTIPYLDGGISISRSSRTYPTYLLFKPGMILTAILLIQYWIANNKLFKSIDNEKKNNNFFLFFGIGSALFLIIHAIFLGLDIENNLYKFLRRVVLLGFIIFEIIAQTLLIIKIINVKSKIKELINSKILFIKIILVSTLIMVALFSAPILNSSEYTHFKHALEWNYFLGVVSFYFLTFMLWRKKKPSVHTPEGV